MKILIAGSGALGSRFAYMLFEAGHNVVLTDLWKQHIDVINHKGLKVIIDGYSMGTYRIPALYPSQVNEEFDLIILVTKAMQVPAMMSSISHCIKDETVLISLVSGLGNVENILPYIKEERLYLGTTTWPSGLAGPGVVDAVGEGKIKLQSYLNILNDNSLELVSILNESGLNVKVSSDVRTLLWEEVAVNSVLNPLCTLIECTIGEFALYHENKRMSELVIDEILEVALREGIVLNKNKILEELSNLYPDTSAGRHYPSMYQDMARGRTTEIDFQNGAIVKLGLKHHVNTPVNDLITHLIRMKTMLVQKKNAE